MRAQDEVWSSGESEPKEEAEADMTGAPNRIVEDTDDGQYELVDHLIYDNSYFPSISDFSGQASICENISLNSGHPSDYF